MRKLPKDKYDNEGWAIKARKSHRCDGDAPHLIRAGQWYYRAVSWPGSDVNSGKIPWIMRICRDCLHEERRIQFDAVCGSRASSEK